MLELIHLLQQAPRLSRDSLGVLLGFCPVCRELRTFRLLHIRRSRHLMGSLIVRTVGHRSVCENCGFALSVAEDRLPPSWPAVPEHAKAEAARVHAGRIDLERRRQAGTLDAKERLKLLREPFVALEGLAGETGDVVAERMNNFQAFRTVASLMVGLTFLAVGGAVFAIPHRRWDRGPTPLSIGLPIALVGAGLFAFSIYCFATARRRFIRAELRGLLKRALAPLAPSREELDLVFLELDGRGVARLLAAKDLV